MSIELVLATFHEESDDTESTARLERVAEVLRGRLQRARRSADEVQLQPDHVAVDLPGGTAEIHPGRALFPIEQLDRLTLSVLFDVARTADMVILTEGGDFLAIVAAASQRARLPEEYRLREVSPQCRSPKHLGALLEAWHRCHSGYRRAAIAAATHQAVVAAPAESSSAEPPRPGSSLPRPSTAESVSTRPAPAAASVIPTGKSCRWDPLREEFIEITKDSESVQLHRFDPAGLRVPKSPGIIERLTTVCREFLSRENPPYYRLVEQSWPPLSVRFEDSSLNIWPAYAELHSYDPRPSLIRLIFEIAREADLSVVAPHAVIVTDPGQAARLPATWRETRKILPCGSAEELSVLLHTLQFDIPPDRRGHDTDPVPGTHPGMRITVYIEAHPQETAVRHQTQIYGTRRPDRTSLPRPEEGMLGAEFWQLQTPSGRRFYAYEYGGEGWGDYLDALARADGRRLGSIVNFETFVQDDGERFPLHECRIDKVDPSEPAAKPAKRPPSRKRKTR